MFKTLTGRALAMTSLLALAACYPHGHVVTVSTDNNPTWTDDHDRALTVVQRLDCPETQGALQRVSADPDGHTCTYKKADEEDIVLSLLALNGQSPRAALAPMEDSLAQLVTVRPGPTPVSIEASHGDGNDKAKIDLPGVHIDADGDKAKVSILGVTVNADGDHADVHAGLGQNSATVHAGPGGAEIRAGQVGAHSANLVYVLAGGAAGPSGYRADGYIARGPISGPLVVGEFKSRSDDRNHHDRDLQDLIDRNVHDAG